jgi:hypothetical protein
VSSDLEEPSPNLSYYRRYRERHKKDKEKDKSDVKLEDIGTKKSELTPSIAIFTIFFIVGFSPA